MITQEELKELFYYDPDTGAFIRLVQRHHRFPAGEKAGFTNAHGYVVINIDGTLYKAHRLAFLYMTGRWPEADVDHRDTVKNNNKWNNLREATRQQNCHNKGPNKNSTTGVKMVTWHKRERKFRVQTMLDGKYKAFGSYKTLEEAIEVAAQVQLTYHGAFARAA